jgi:hypothetical protein
MFYNPSPQLPRSAINQGNPQPEKMHAYSAAKISAKIIKASKPN